jgi:hypothetical protein
MRPFAWALAVAVALTPAAAGAAEPRPVRTLAGSGNNLRHPDWGRAHTLYPRVVPARYADGKSAPVAGPSPRYVSNRIFNDTSQNLFSENGVTQWGAVWGQFLDHTFGERAFAGGERTPLAFHAGDPLETFRNDLGAIGFERTPAAIGTGRTSPRQQVNRVGGYIDASAVYGDSVERLRWLRVRGANGLGARLLLPGGYLPRADARGDATRAPGMSLMGRLTGAPDEAVVAGDMRANENLALTATHTLFAREHNRIAAALPRSLSDERRFQIARRIVGAEQQFITYREFLPALGVRLSPDRGYRPHVNAAITNEFATVGFRAHSMIHGEFEPIARAGAYSAEQRAAFAAQGIEIEAEAGADVLVVPLNVAFGNPGLLPQIRLGPLLRGLGGEPQYRNDEQIDNQLRSVLFEIPRGGAPNPAGCLDGPAMPECFQGVLDLAALDIARGRDHGMPSYNTLRRAFGLRAKRDFTAITGERTDRFPDDPEIDASDPLGDPDILDFVSLRDAAGNPIPLGTPEADGDAVSGIRRTTLAARLRAIYGDVDRLDAFVGMVAEEHVPGTEFGELQLAMWRKQFEALRDGDRFFHARDPLLRTIKRRYGITYKHSLAGIIALNTGERMPPRVFEAAR